MQKNKTIAVVALVLTLFMLYSVTPAIAGVNSISVIPGIISVGDTTKIILTTDKAATGKLKVTYKPTSTSWFATTDISIGAGGGSQQWIFPTDFEAGANTNNIGDYDVEATLDWVPKATFKVEFFVIHDLPLGTIMALVACFGAVVGYKKLRRYSIKNN